MAQEKNQKDKQTQTVSKTGVKAGALEAIPKNLVNRLIKTGIAQSKPEPFGKLLVDKGARGEVSM